MKPKHLKKEEWAVIFALLGISAILFALTIWGIKCVIHGNLFAVVWTVFTAGGACVLSEEAENIYKNTPDSRK